MESPAVSVILPVYNGERFIHDCVESILTQSFLDFELIIVNDGSTDSTPILLHPFAENDPRIRIISILHSGVAEAMNAGMKEAKGKYIARMDADDEMMPERLQKQFDFLESHPDIGVVSSLVQHGGDPELQKGYATHIQWINSLITHEDIFLNRFVDSPVCNPSVMFRKELVEKSGGCRTGNFPEDYEMWLRWMENGVRFEKISELLLHWNDPHTRITRTDERYSPEAFNRIKTGFLVNHIHRFIGDRELWLCGAGRITRKKSELLSEHGINIAGYIDVDPKKIGRTFNALPVISLNELKGKEKNFVVSYVGNRGAREDIDSILRSKGFVPGNDFILAG